MKVKKLSVFGLYALYKLMKRAKFPNINQGFWKCFLDLMSVEVFAVYKKGRLIAAFLYGEDGHKGAFLDLVCAPEHESTWLQKKVIKRLITEGLKYKVIWVEPKHDYALKLCIKAGFQPIEHRFSTPLLVTTAQQLEQRFLRIRDRNYGISIWGL